jgi:hypothetical protein
MIKSGDLANRAVTDPAGSEAVRADIQRMKGRPKPELGLAERLQAARALVPTRDDQMHCGHCWGEGRDATIKMIEGA